MARACFGAAASTTCNAALVVDDRIVGFHIDVRD